MMKFSYESYKNTHIPSSRCFNLYRNIDLGKCIQKILDFEQSKSKNVYQAFFSLKERMPEEYIRKMFGAQINVLSMAQSIFPLYRCLLPEELMNDWQALVDPHNMYSKRDHSLHQPMVAYITSTLLGHGIVDNSLKVGHKHLLDICADKLLKNPILWSYLTDLFPPINKWLLDKQQLLAQELVYQASIISSLFHDIGYSWQCLNQKTKILSEIEYIKLNNSQLEDALYNCVQGRLLELPFWGYDQCAMEHPSQESRNDVKKLIIEAYQGTHGFASALAFLYLQDCIHDNSKQTDFWSAMSRFVIDWAALGMLMHDMKDLYMTKKGIANPRYRLSFDKDPVSCIIAMSDVFEEFNRPFVAFSPMIKSNVNMTYQYYCDTTLVSVSNNVIKIVDKYKNVGVNISEFKSRVLHRDDELYEYFDINNGFIDLSSIGIQQYSYKCKLK